MKEYLIIGILSICSLACIIIAAKILLIIKKITKFGAEAEGVIFDLVQSGGSAGNITYPIVRFVTDQKEWITEKSMIGAIPGMYKKGAKVIVVYEIDSPNNFFIKDKLTYIVPAIILIIGAALMSFAMFQLIHV